jgi:hypothetical protein
LASGRFLEGAHTNRCDQTRQKDATEANVHRYHARTQSDRNQVAISDRQPGDECEIRRIGYWPTLKVADKHAKQ